MLFQQANPNVSFGQQASKNPGGKPSKAIRTIPIVLARERSSSPSFLDEIRSTNKARSVDIDGNISLPSDMDVENGGHTPNMDLQGNGAGSKVGDVAGDTAFDTTPASYVSKVSKSIKIDDPTHVPGFTNVEVVVIEEDVLVDRNSIIPSIKFSN
ncbi:hypothetical protein V6N11_069045 [Hibiscus sabdariffa]|uniref:Uncharacterized protein n=2 Tax=Hibiscus sabdariffa TaxID=183260 RepID=A0ABR2GAB6_9ROSI